MKALLLLSVFLPALAFAQVGEHRNQFSIGAGAGYVMSNVSFDPRVSQSQHGGIIAGASFRYVCEKYFKTICSVQAEVNYASIGWQESILTRTDEKVINANGQAEEYSRTINYVQIPVMAHLAWGREQKGVNIFVQAGPQIGIYLGESTKKNYTTPNLANDGTGRSNTVVRQEEMPVENKLDYGIAAGLGAEWSHPRAGRFILEARYYYGLGNIYGSTKRDYFGRSNFGNIIVKATYLFDLIKNN